MKKLLFLTVVPLICKVCVAQDKIKPDPQLNSLPLGASPKISLTGDEILVTYTERGGQTKTDAFLPKKIKTQWRLDKPVPVIRGGQKVSWSPSNKLISFLRSDDLWLSDRNGSEAYVCPAPTGSSRAFQSPVQWDSSGKAYSFRRMASFGSVLARSDDLIDPTPVSEVVGRQTAGYVFGEKIIPFRSELSDWPKEESNTAVEKVNGSMCIGAASFSPDQSWVAAQIYPPMPYDMGASESQIYRINLSDRKDVALKDSFEEIMKNYFFEGGIEPQVKGKPGILWPQSSRFSDSNPVFSPSGKWLAFDRLDKRTKTVVPCIFDCGDKKVEFVQTANISSLYQSPGQDSWGWPTLEILQWDIGKKEGAEGLWFMTTTHDAIYRAERVGTQWVPTQKVLYAASDDAQITFARVHDDWLIWAGNRDETGNIHFLNWKSNENLTFGLPAGSMVNWIS